MLRYAVTALACASFSVVTGTSNPTLNFPLPSPVVAMESAISPLRGVNRYSDVITASIRPQEIIPENELDAEPDDEEPDNEDEPDSDKEETARGPLSAEEICQVMQEAAEEHELPVPLFTRLIWQESRFRPKAVSPVGARGIAQFMPGTAAERGLEDPFDPAQALPASAEFLRELVDQFGNFGLAAAAYNGGPGRVTKWLAGKGRLPRETREYVILITGQSPEHWAEASAYGEPHPDANDVEDCKVRPIRAAYALLKEPDQRKERWGVQLTGNWSEKKALATYAKIRKKYPTILDQRHPTVVTTKAARKGRASRTTVRVIADTRSEADAMCKRLKEAGGSCSVKKMS